VLIVSNDLGDFAAPISNLAQRISNELSKEDIKELQEGFG
jgi:hypothetical protein